MGKKKDKKNKGGTGSEYFDYRYGVGEAKHMMKRYDVEGASMGNPRMGGKQRSVDDVKKDLADAMMNDYDTRRTMEAAAMAGNKDAKKYAKKGIKGGNIQDAYGVMRDLKKEYVGGGGMDGSKNRAGLTYAAVKADRKNFIADNDAKYASKDDLSALEQQQAAAPEEKYEPSPEITEAKKKVADWESGSFDKDVYGSGISSSAVYGNDDEQDAAAITPANVSKKKAGSMLEGFKQTLKERKNLQPTL